MSLAQQNREVIAAHRAAGGRLVFNGMPILLLTTTRPSGRAVTTPVAALWDGDRIVFCASRGGKPEHPRWYQDIARDPEVLVEYDGHRFRAEVRTLPDGPERERLIHLMTTVVPGMARYDERARPHRLLPVLVVSVTD